jgi:hypothetical protein
MLRNEFNQPFEPGLESAYAVIVPSAKEAMARRILTQLGKAHGAGRLPPGPRRKPRTGKRPPITKDTANLIRELIEAWPHGTLSWEDVVVAVNKSFGTKWHRQSLANHGKIKAAFQAKKIELRKSAAAGLKPKARATDSTVEYLERQLKQATGQVVELRLQLQEAEARMARWRHNAYLRGLTLEQLETPMQENDRGRSDL